MNTNKEVIIQKLIENSLDEQTSTRILKLIDGKTPERNELMTTRAAAEYVDCHPVTLRQWGLKGILHPIRHTSRRIRWSKRELDQFLIHGPEVK